MKRGKTVAIAVAAAFLLAVPAGAQVAQIEASDIVPTDHLTHLAEAFKAAGDGIDYDIRFSNPGEAFAVTDPTGDAEFSTGETPSQTLPVEFDIQNFAAYLFTGNPETNPGKFSSVDAGGLFCGGGEPNSGLPDLRTFCQPQFDSTDFTDGAYIASFEVAGDFGLFDSTQICEFVVWYDDGTRNNVFNRLDQFPNDPADGTNTAFGVRSTLGDVQPFGLELTDGGFFQDMPTSTIAIFGGDEVSLVIPSMYVAEPMHMRAYTFCTGGSFSASDSFADTSLAFDPAPTELLITEVVATTTSTSTTTSTTTTTQPATTTLAASEPTSVATSDEGFPWWAVIIGGLIIVGIGLWMAARKKGCEDELRAWQAAQKACDEASEAHKKTQTAVNDAEKALDDAEEELDKLCDAMPPVCSGRDIEDDWIEDADVPGSRIDGFDVFAKRAWGRSNWKKYRDGDMTAQEVEQAWEEEPPSDFKDTLRKEYDAAKGKKKDLDKKIEHAEEDLDNADKAEEAAADKAKEACDKAAQAKAAYDLCMKKPTPAPAPAPTGGTAGGTTGDPGSTPGTTGGGEQEPDKGCEPEDSVKEGTSVTKRIVVPIRLEPQISGGAAHAARELAEEIGGGLRQAETVNEALGRLFSFGSSGKVVTDFSVAGAADLAAGATSEATGIPIPTNIPTAVSNVAGVYIKAGRTIIEKVPELQERRLPDVDLRIIVKKQPYTLTCTQLLRCRNGEWVEDGKRLTVEQGPMMSARGSLSAGLTWAQAQAAIASYAQRRFSREMTRALTQMKTFQNECRGG